MKKFRHLLLFSFSIFLFFCLADRQVFFTFVYASESEFSSICHTSYQVLETGNAVVTQEISIINKRPDIYVSEYTLKLSGENIQNIKAWDKIGPLKVNSSLSGKTMNVSLSFNEKVVGKGQVLSFIVKYEIIKFAKKEGQIWKVILPKISQENLPDEYTLELKIPLSFGSLAFASPYPLNSEIKEQNFVYSFNKSELVDYGAILTFGNYQVFDFTLIYQLQNQTNYQVFEEITLPPDTNYQRVEYNKIDPPPLKITMDSDGNWLAKFRLPPNSKSEIKASGKVKIFSTPIQNLPQTWTPYHLEPRKFWESDNEIIIQQAKKFKTAKEIYSFVVKSLDYDYERIKEERERFGALEALSNPKKALCLEFTDLFIALARAAGIPAREIEGVAYTDNPKLRPISLVQDVLHSWPEYYDFETSTWRMIDPTWGKTTGGFDYFNYFDMSHFTFVIHGKDSSYPPPAGSFKFSGEEGKNVFVEFGEDSPPLKTEVSLSLKFSPPNLRTFEMEGILEIKNQGGTAVYNLPIELVNPSLDIIISPKIVSHILPYGKNQVLIRIKDISPLLRRPFKSSILIRAGDKELREEVTLIPLIKKLVQRAIQFLLIGISLILIIRIILGYKKRKAKVRSFT